VKNSYTSKSSSDEGLCKHIGMPVSFFHVGTISSTFGSPYLLDIPMLIENKPDDVDPQTTFS